MAGSGRASGPASGSAARFKTLVLVTFSTTAGVIRVLRLLPVRLRRRRCLSQVFFPNLPVSQALVLSYLAFGAGSPRGFWARSYSHTLVTK